MLAECKNELICDFAETYGIYDIYKFDTIYISTLALGLRENSRTKLKISEQKASLDTILLASILDQLNGLIWMLSDNKSERPKRVSNILLGEEADAYETFLTPEEFEERWKAINEGGGA